MKGSGIYVIRNRINGKVYVGSSRNIQKRVNNHLSYLRRGVHPNSHLQHAWHQYGEANFYIKVIERITSGSIQELEVAEQRWIDHLAACDPGNGYNLMLSTVRSHVVHSEATRKKISAQRKGMKFAPEHRANIGRAKKGKQLSEEHRRKIGLATKGRSHTLETRIKIGKNRRPYSPSQQVRNRIREKLKGRIKGPHSEQARNRMSMAKAKLYKVTSPDGNVVIVPHLPSFCENQGLSRSGMANVAYGLARHHKGWRCERVDER